MFSYLTKILADRNGTPSSKRWIAFGCFIMITVTWAVNLFASFPFSEHIFDSLMYTTLVSLGITGLEKFAPLIDK